MSIICQYNPKLRCPDSIRICPLSHDKFRGQLDRYFLGRDPDDDPIGMPHIPLSGDDYKQFKRSVMYFLFPVDKKSNNLDSTIDEVEQWYRYGTLTQVACRALCIAFRNFERIQLDHADRFFEWLKGPE